MSGLAVVWWSTVMAGRGFLVEEEVTACDCKLHWHSSFSNRPTRCSWGYIDSEEHLCSNTHREGNTSDKNICHFEIYPSQSFAHLREGFQSLCLLNERPDTDYSRNSWPLSRFLKFVFGLTCLTSPAPCFNTDEKWGVYALRHGIQISMEAILACHRARSPEMTGLPPKIVRSMM